MKTQPRAILAAYLGIALIVASCSSAQSDWTKASTENSVAAYQTFIAAHPEDQHVSEAHPRIVTLQDDNARAEAKNSSTVASYQAYLQQSPQGAHIAAARDAMAAINPAAAWKAAQDAGTAASIQAFLQKYPTGAEADQAKAKLNELTGYRARLARESSDSLRRTGLLLLRFELHAFKKHFLPINGDLSGALQSQDALEDRTPIVISSSMRNRSPT